jgi:hypothetical protein
LTNRRYSYPTYIDTNLTIGDVLCKFYGLNIFVENHRNTEKVKKELSKFNKYFSIKSEEFYGAGLDGNVLKNKFPSLYDLSRSDFVFDINICEDIYEEPHLQINRRKITLSRIYKRDLQIMRSAPISESGIFTDYMSFLGILIPDE